MTMTTVQSADDVRIVTPGTGAVTFSAEAILGFRDRIRDLEDELRGLREYAAGHHAHEESHVWLHSLTVDIPSRIEVALDGR